MDAESFKRGFDALIEAARFDEAASLIEAAFPASPDAPLAHYARGVVAIFRREFDAAERELRAVVAAAPDFAPAHHDLGALAQWRKDYQSSIAHLQRAIALDPANRGSYVALAQSLFAAGRYDEGWRCFEAREGGLGQHPRPRGLWDGSPIPGGALGVVAEEGIGDTIQFCRYVATVRDRVARVYLVVDGQYAALAPLLREMDGIDAVVTDRRTGPPINAYVPVMTLAHLAGASPAHPLDVPYLRAPPEREARWRARLGETPLRRVGLVWGGNPRSTARASDIDSRRSIDPALLAPLAEVPGIEWHSLQLGPAAARAGRLAAAFRLRDMTEHIGDFADTAALIANLDLVISVDTSVVHVAGAIGAPTWMLNRFDSCWRWGPDGDATGWYPSVRIFRQPAFGDWPSVVAAVRDALAAHDSTPPRPSSACPRREPPRRQA
jgi:hypothetical protein